MSKFASGQTTRFGSAIVDAERAKNQAALRRPISFEQAKAKFVHRFTMEHIPNWARFPLTIDGATVYYAPQYRSDREWYDSTLFHGESELATRKFCHSSNATWPLGKRLTKPYRREA